MNILCTDPYSVVDPKILEQYFEDTRNCSFDVACNVYASYPHDELVGSLATTYTRFAYESRRRGFPACIRMHVSYCKSDLVGISEAQYHVDNSPDLAGDQGFHASFASAQWKDYLKNAIQLFAQDYGYNWLLLEPPIYRIDIPGTKDRFYRTFIHRYPEVAYPERRCESSAYLKVQQLKVDLAVEFYTELAQYAKSVGIEKVGVILNTFTPPIVNPIAPEIQYLDNSRIVTLPSVDFVVTPAIKVLEDNPDRQLDVPLQSYAETISQINCKPVLLGVDYPSLFDPQSKRRTSTDGLTKPGRCSLAAAPSGILKDWDKTNFTCLPDQFQALATVNKVLSRFNNQAAPVAFVYSASASRHTEPHTRDTVWPFYSSIINQMLFAVRAPILTLSADVLAQQLEANPQLTMLILEEHFPLTSDQVSTVLNWWKAEPSRALLVIGNGTGFSADLDKPGVRPLSEAFPGLLDRIGLIQLDPPSIETKGGHVTLKPNGGIKPDLQNERTGVETPRFANIQRVFGSGARVIFSDAHARPLIVEWKSGRTAAYFCGLGSSQNTAQVVIDLIRYAFQSVKAQKPPVSTSNCRTIWNGTPDGYIVVTNCSDEESKVTVYNKPHAYWDILNETLVRDIDAETTLAPGSLLFLRKVAKRSKFYDVANATHIVSITDGAGKADIALTTGINTAFVVRTLPREVLVDDMPAEISAEHFDGFSKVYIPNLEPGDHTVTLRW